MIYIITFISSHKKNYNFCKFFALINFTIYIYFLIFIKKILIIVRENT